MDIAEKLKKELQDAEIEKRSLQSNRQTANPPQAQENEILSKIQAEFEGLSQGEVSEIIQTTLFKDADKDVDDALTMYIKQLFAPSFIQTEIGKKVYENYLEAIQKAKNAVSTQRESEWDEFQNWKRTQKK